MKIQACKIVSAFLFTAIMLTAIMPCRAASPTNTAQEATTKAYDAAKVKAAGAWPKWYYMDQLGLKEWNSGDRPQAKQKWEYALSLAESELRQRTTKLDPITSRRVKEFINHQVMLVQYFDLPKKGQLAGKSAEDQYIRINDARIEDIDRKLKYLDRVERLGTSVLGKGHYAIQPFSRIRVKHEEWKNRMKYENEVKQGWPIGSYDNGGKQGKYGEAKVIQDRRDIKAPDWYAKSKTRETYSWQRDTHQKVQTKAQGPLDPKRFNTSHQSGAGTMYVGGKQVKVDAKPDPYKGNVGNVAGAPSKEWGVNPPGNAKKPVPWGQYDSNDRGPDFNSKPKPPAWGTTTNPVDPTKNGWGNNTWGNEEKKPNPSGGSGKTPSADYWK